MTTTIKIKLSGSGIVPKYQTKDSAGFDLTAIEGKILKPGERQLFSTGIQMAIPEGYEGQIRSRSGLAIKHGVVVINSPGTIDSDYRGDIKVGLINHGATDFEVLAGTRIAQMIITPITTVNFQLCSQLDATIRNHGGFGSTGLGN